ncbi:MAG: hypothetical protein ACSLFB_05690 [Acidimicrobiales bacterium]
MPGRHRRERQARPTPQQTTVSLRCEPVASGLSALALAFVIFQFSFDPAGEGDKHRIAAKELWYLREQYCNLLTDVRRGVSEDAPPSAGAVVPPLVQRLSPRGSGHSMRVLVSMRSAPIWNSFRKSSVG